MTETMTTRERWLAAIRMEPVDRLPFWPKLDAAYPRAQTAPFRDMALDDIHDWIGSDKHTGVASCVKETRERTTVETSRQNGTCRTVYRTSHGSVESITQFDEASQSWHPARFPVQSVDDIRPMTEVYEDVTVGLDADRLRKAQEQCEAVGCDGLTACTIGTSPLMHWIEWLAGVENGHLLLTDHRQEVEALFRAMHKVLLRKAEILSKHLPADVLYMIENTSTTLISPGQFRRYCRAHLTEYGEITRAAGRILVLHMCGHLKALLPDLSGIPAEAFEAFTAPPLGNTRLLDGRTECPDKCLIGGTDATLWTRSAAEIIARIRTDLEALPHHRGLVVTSAGVMPPGCRPETIREVCAWVKSYRARM